MGAQERARVLFYCGIGSGLLFVIVAAVTVMTRSIDVPTLIVLLTYSASAFGLVGAAQLLSRRSGPDDE